MRLVTRSDFDGLVCGSLLKVLGIIDHWLFVHPKDMQDGIVEITSDDVLANVPFVPGCGMWFDHHISELKRMGKDVMAPGACYLAPSAARVIYEYYDGDNTIPHYQGLVKACDKVDFGQLTAEEILNPTGGVLLGFLMDPRTGLGRFRNFTISNYNLMSKLLDACAALEVDEILQLSDVKERIEVYHEQSALFKAMLLDRSVVRDNVIVTDVRGVDPIFAGNRFLIYSLFPEQNVSVWVADGRGRQNVIIAIGYSVLNRTCESDIGEICLSYGGGGHRQVGTCQVAHEEADRIVEEIVNTLVASHNNCKEHMIPRSL